jgi:hypothetical protein
MRCGSTYCFAALLLLCGCESSTLQGVEGRWAGQIICLGQTSDLTLGLTVEKSLILGSAQIRTKNSNSDFQSRGEQVDLERILECKDPSCTTDEDCASKLDSKGEAPMSQCTNYECAPCYDKEIWPQVQISLKDENVQIPDPVLKLWRFGDQRMEGTIERFCPDETLQTPKVKVNKE